MAPPRSSLSLLAIGLTVIAACRAPSAPAPLKGIDDLPNPGRGWVTHSSFRGDPQNASQPGSTIAYFRITWREAEPTEGRYAFDAMDALVSRARRDRQRVAFRIVADQGRGGPGVPDWLLRKRIHGWPYAGADGSRCFSPDAADPVFMAHAEQLIRAFGARYDGHAGIEFVDIGLVGDFGEWHYTAAAPVGAAMPPSAVRTRYVDWYFEAFPESLLIMPVGDPATGADALSYAVARGAGWRADCWGDYRQPWNHMVHDYPAKLRAAGVAGAWRTRPVILESCGVPGDWYAAHPDRLEAILAFAIDNHASVLDGKSSRLPGAWIARFSEFTSHIGYRLALASPADLPARVAPGRTARVAMTWTNLGNAPVYRGYTLAVRLREQGREVSRAQSATDPRRWMPRSADGVNYRETVELAVPAGSRGTLSVQAALIDPRTGEPAVQLAMPGRNDDLWYDLGTILVR